MRAHAVSERVPTDVSDPGQVGVTARAGAGQAVAHRRPDSLVDQARSVFKRTVAVRPVTLSRNRRADETGRVMTLPGALLWLLAGIVGEPHVLTGDATACFAVDWTGRSPPSGAGRGRRVARTSAGPWPGLRCRPTPGTSRTGAASGPSSGGPTGGSGRRGCPARVPRRGGAGSLQPGAAPP